MMPFSQHTYLWYSYDPQSKTVLYLARQSTFDGLKMQLTEDRGKTFIYDAKKHGYPSWVYDVRKKKMHPPSFGRPFKNMWHLAVIGTPTGAYAAIDKKLYHAKVDEKSGSVDWRLVDGRFPLPAAKIKYHYEFQPLIYDAKRNRLIQLKGDKQRVDVFSRSLEPGSSWQQLKTSGQAAIGREAVYIPGSDKILWLGDKLYSFNCKTSEMKHVKVKLPKGLYGHECSMVYDPKHDVCVVLIPKSFTGPMQTFLFRYNS